MNNHLISLLVATLAVGILSAPHSKDVTATVADGLSTIHLSPPEYQEEIKIQDLPGDVQAKIARKLHHPVDLLSAKLSSKFLNQEIGELPLNTHCAKLKNYMKIDIDAKQVTLDEFVLRDTLEKYAPEKTVGRPFFGTKLAHEMVHFYRDFPKCVNQIEQNGYMVHGIMEQDVREFSELSDSKFKTYWAVKPFALLCEGLYRDPAPISNTTFPYMLLREADVMSKRAVFAKLIPSLEAKTIIIDEDGSDMQVQTSNVEGNEDKFKRRTQELLDQVKIMSEESRTYIPAWCHFGSFNSFAIDADNDLLVEGLLKLQGRLTRDDICECKREYLFRHRNGIGARVGRFFEENDCNHVVVEAHDEWHNVWDDFEDILEDI